MSSTPEAALAAYFDALNRSDSEAFTSRFDDEDLFLGDGEATASGRAEIRATAEGALQAMRVENSYDVDRLSSATGAVVQTHSHGTMTMPEPGTTVPSANRELYVLRHDGERSLFTHPMYDSASGGAGAK